MNRHLISLTLLVFLARPSLACQVPVFRYALENWEPDRLVVAIIESPAVKAQADAGVAVLRQAMNADEKVNLQVHRIDVEAVHPPGSPDAFYAETWKDKPLPHMLVFFANDSPEPQLAWSGMMNEANTQAVISSPQRQVITERLLDGQSAVWVLLLSGDQAADERAERILREELRNKPAEIELPSLTDLASEERFDELLPVEMRVEFSLITISPKDQEEAFLREMLLNTERDLPDLVNEPIAIPIYGRGRTYFALVGAGINAENITDNCRFICGACSCEVKRDNPGQDLLLAANWNRVQPGTWVNDTPLPALTGIGGFDSMTEVAGKPTPSPVDVTEPSPPLVEQDDEVATTTPAATAPSEAAPAAPQNPADSLTDTSSTHDLTVLVLGWAGALFAIGLVFTLWRRTRITE